MTKAELVKRVARALARYDCAYPSQIDKDLPAGIKYWETYKGAAEEVVRSLHYAPGVQVTYSKEPA